jgi:hypothetical protein
LRCGGYLLQAKEQNGHGNWITWLAENCPDISERMAQRYMRVARELPKLNLANPTRLSDITLGQAIEMLGHNAKMARQHGEDTLEEKTVDIPQALHATETRKWQDARAYRRREKRLRLETQQQQMAIQERIEVGEPPPTMPESTDNQWNLLGLKEEELVALDAELHTLELRFAELAESLKNDYEYAVPRLAVYAYDAVRKLRDRLTYSRDHLNHAVYGLRDLLKEGPVLGKYVRQWAKKAEVSRGLLALASKILDIGESGNGSGDGKVYWDYADNIRRRMGM